MKAAGIVIDDESLQMPLPYTESNANTYMYIESETVERSNADAIYHPAHDRYDSPKNSVASMQKIAHSLWNRSCRRDNSIALLGAFAEGLSPIVFSNRRQRSIEGLEIVFANG